VVAVSDFWAIMLMFAVGCLFLIAGSALFIEWVWP
jgi:hypothetical protein